MEGIFAAWGRILTGYTPALSIEITRECPLHCPGCYAYGDDHLGGGELTLRTVRDFKGQELVDNFMNHAGQRRDCRRDRRKCENQCRDQGCPPDVDCRSTANAMTCTSSGRPRFDSRRSTGIASEAP